MTDEITDWDKLQLEAAEAALKSKQALLDYVLQGEGYADLIAACDAALDWADANARWFDISTAPLNGGSSAKFQVLYDGGHFEDAWSYAGKIWVADQDGCDCQVSLGDATHWRPIINPPLGQLPAPLEALGAVLRRVKGVG